MPKIVVLDTSVVPGTVIRNFLAGGKGHADVELYVDDALTNFSYVEDKKKIQTLENCRLADVVMNITNTKNNAKVSLADTATVTAITLDVSRENHSALITVPTADILEYHKEPEVPDGTVIDDATLLPLLKLKAHAIMSDKTEVDIDLKEGMCFKGLIFKTTPAPKIVIGNFELRGFKYTMTGGLSVSALILGNDKNVYTVPLSDIKNFGTVAEDTKVDDDFDLSNVISQEASEEGSDVLINLGNAGAMAKPLTISADKPVSVYGVQAFTPANTGARANATVDPSVENILEDSISVEEGADVTLVGMAVSQKALMKLNNAASVTLKNCKITGVDASDTGVAKNFVITGGSVSDETHSTKLIMDGCYFGPNVVVEDPDFEGDISKAKTRIHNTMELNMRLADGSRISNCTFATGASTHNVINIYHVEDGATITIENNVFESNCEGPVRVGTVGNPTATFVMSGNTWHGYNPADGYQEALVTLQPYGSMTTDMAGLTFQFKNNNNIVPADKKNNKRSDIVLFQDVADLDLKNHEEYRPTVYINGVEVKKSALQFAN